MSLQRLMVPMGAVVLGAALLGGCSDSVAGDRVTPAELSAALNAGTAIALDVRGKSYYDAQHIAGALHMNLGEIASRAPSELPKDKRIITYCS